MLPENCGQFGRSMSLTEYRLYRFRENLRRRYVGDLRHLAYPPGQDWIEVGIEAEAQRAELLQMMRDHPAWDIACSHIDENGDLTSARMLARQEVGWALGGLTSGRCTQEVQRFFGGEVVDWVQAGLVFNSWEIDTSNRPGTGVTRWIDHLEMGGSKYSGETSILSEKRRIMADVCRDFYLTPWICWIEVDERMDDDPGKTAALNQFKQALYRAEALIWDNRTHSLTDLPGQWVAMAYVQIVARSSHAGFIPPGLPVQALKVLVSLADDMLDDAVSQDWDLCLAYGSAKPVRSRTDPPWQGWVVSKETTAFVKLIGLHAHADAFRQLATSMASPTPAVVKASVVVCTYRRIKLLRQALESVAHQTFPPGDYEVLVVNNDPADSGVASLVDELRRTAFSASPERLRLMECPIPGLSQARNLGLAVARGEIVCFLDDDAVADANWLEQIVLAFEEHPRAGVVGGHIRLKHPQPRPTILMEGLERFWTQLLTPHSAYTEVQSYLEYPWGANWCARREALLAVGGFRSQYGRRKRDYSGGEEIIAASLIQRLRYAVAIQPSALVLHQPEESRYTYRYLRDTIVAQIMINYRMRRDLYLGKAVTLGATVRGTGRFAGRLAKLLSLPKERRKALALEYFCYSQAWARMFFEQLGDHWIRLWRCP
jgi:glycosyltransferase involved in cell wall biosynthesis